MDLTKLENLQAILNTISGIGDNAAWVAVAAMVIYFLVESVGYVVGLGFMFVLYRLIDKGAVLLKEHLKGSEVRQTKLIDSQQVSSKAINILKGLRNLTHIGSPGILTERELSELTQYLEGLIITDKGK